MSERVTRTHCGAMGGVEWHTTFGIYVWFGPGWGLCLVLNNGGPMRIEHPAASGTYDTPRDARRALEAFLAAVSPQEGSRQQ